MLAHVLLKVAEVLGVLVDQITVVALPFLPGVGYPGKVSSNPLQELHGQLDLEVLLDAEVGAADWDAWVNLLLEALHVGEGVFEVSFESIVLKDVAKVLNRVRDVVDVSTKMLIRLLQKH